MCAPALLALPAMIGQGIAAGATAIGSAVSGLAAGGAAAGGAAAGGAAAGGFTFGQALSLAGTAASVGGTLYEASATAQAAEANAKYAEREAAMERQLGVIEDERTRARMRSAIARQRAELAGRGVSLDSPTAVLLGRQAAQEMSFASQSARSGASARATQLTAESRAWQARAGGAMFGGRLSAAAGLLERAPTLWPGLADRRMFA